VVEFRPLRHLELDLSVQLLDRPLEGVPQEVPPVPLLAVALPAVKDLAPHQRCSLASRGGPKRQRFAADSPEDMRFSLFPVVAK
jgi:hypothetical protein